MIKIKRAYEAKERGDGYRILVDRLWPRGLTKEKVAADLWLKNISPSTKLRKWFGHDPKKWGEFKKRYEKEIKNNSEEFDILKKIIKKEKNITLIYGAKDEEHNNAEVIKEMLE